MGKGKTGKDLQQQGQHSPQAAPSFTWVLYLLILIIAAGLYTVYSYKQRMDRADRQAQYAAQEQHRETLAQQNIALGLPETYPSDFMPLYPGVELLEASAEDAMAEDGAPMDKWHVLGQTDNEKQAVLDFYMQRFTAEDMRQTMYISLPSGYSLGYADENRIVELRIEKLSADPKPQVEITVYVVKGYPTSKSPYDPLSQAEAAPDSPVTEHSSVGDGSEGQTAETTSDPPT